MIESTANPRGRPQSRRRRGPPLDRARAGRRPSCGAARRRRRQARRGRSDLNLFYGDFHAVQDVNMTIEPNKVTALIGSSGCGKSTFLRSLNRMHELIPGRSRRGRRS